MRGEASPSSTSTSNNQTVSVAAAGAQSRKSQSTHLDCSILIVAFQSINVIEQCLDSIANNTGSLKIEILLIDNGDLSTQAFVEQHYPEVRIVPSEGNIGFAGGNNALARHALSDWLLLLNPDMTLYSGALEKLIDGANAHPEAAAWGGVSCDAQGKPDSGNFILVPSLAEQLRFALGRSSQPDPSHPALSGDSRTDFLLGGFVMLSRDAWDSVNGLDERYFLYCEEVDLFYRLARMGKTFWRIGQARGHHASGHGQPMSAMRILYRTAGTVEFMRIHWGFGRRFLGCVLLWAGALNRYFVGSLIGRIRPRLAEVAKGYSLVALRPGSWWHGYDPERGLRARMRREADA